MKSYYSSEEPLGDLQSAPRWRLVAEWLTLSITPTLIDSHRFGWDPKTERKNSKPLLKPVRSLDHMKWNSAILVERSRRSYSPVLSWSMIAWTAETPKKPILNFQQAPLPPLRFVSAHVAETLSGEPPNERWMASFDIINYLRPNSVYAAFPLPVRRMMAVDLPTHSQESRFMAECSMCLFEV